MPSRERLSEQGTDHVFAKAKTWSVPYLLFLAAVLLTACKEENWNSPYASQDIAANVLFSSFTERPKHLDPVRSYSSTEYAFIAQIYEPPLQYHYLKRPYELVPLVADKMPVVRFYDSKRRHLSKNAKIDRIAFSEYEIKIQPGVQYQPHPALAKDGNNQYRYHALSEADIEDVYTLNDFEHQGSRELTAQDFVHQIKRMADQHLHCPIASLMKDYIVGLDRLSDQIAADRKQGKSIDLSGYAIEGVKVVDKYTYRILIKGKYPQFQYWLAMPFFAPMPWEADIFYAQPGMDERNINLHWYPIGTGPFMLTENNPNLRMVLEKNPNFHGELYPEKGGPGDAEAGLLVDAGKPLPFIDKAVYSLEKETIPYWNKFLQGYYDSSGVSSDSFDQAVQFNSQGEVGLTEGMRAKGIELNTAVTTSIFYMGFNMLDSIVGGDGDRARYLRRAIAIAVNYEEFISIFANGRGIAAQSPVPPKIFGHVAGEKGINPYVYTWEDGAPKRRSIDEAKEWMSKADYPDGIDAKTGEPLVLYFDTPASGPDAKARLNWIVKQLDQIGLQLVVRSTDYNRFQEKMLKGTAQLFQWGWNADYPDPENFLFLLYGPNAKVEGQGENAANYQNAQFDRLFERMKNMENSRQRQRIIDQMVELLRQDTPWLFGYHPKAFSLHHAWYGNAKPNLMANNSLKYKRIDSKLRVSGQKEWNAPVVRPLLWVGGLFVVSLIPAVLTFRRRKHATGLSGGRRP